MKKSIFSLVMLAAFAGTVSAQEPVSTGYVIPTVKDLSVGKGTATISRQSKVTVSDKTLDYAAYYLRESLRLLDVPLEGRPPPFNCR